MDVGFGKWIAIVSISLITIVAFVGNFLVTYVILTNKHMRTVPNFLLVSLALSDFLVAAVVMPFNIADYALTNESQKTYMRISDITCKSFLYLDVFGCTASIFNLVVISLDRYFAIRSPLKYVHYRTLKRLMIVLAITYIFSALVTTPTVMVQKENVAQDRCDHQYKGWIIIYTACGSFFIPALIMLSLYAKIFHELRNRLSKRKQRSALNKVESMTQNSHPQTSTTTIVIKSTIFGRKHETSFKFPGRKQQSQPPPTIEIGTPMQTSCYCPTVHETDLDDSNINRPNGSEKKELLYAETNCYSPTNSEVSAQVSKSFIQQRSKQQITLSAERQAARTLGIIMGVFMICWMPFFLEYLCRSNLAFEYNSYGIHNMILTWLGYLNSALNPVIYTIFNYDFRQAFQLFLRLDKWPCTKRCQTSSKAQRRNTLVCCTHSKSTSKDAVVITGSAEPSQTKTR
ncbi:hypothetical protein Ciccas_001497 [Cichlidogyrus casuarinus]|uniref:G-protein coupled receptors family 1 profile domain-containing protein n=1 Tax=Cichlidogyrus casuarinus TaxID=1844966 RepID=A0ABD2QN17_9PLAT